MKPKFKPAELVELERLRWPAHVHCPKCRGTNVHSFPLPEGYNQHACLDCRAKFTALTDSYIMSNKAPLRAWLDTYYAEVSGGTTVRAVIERTGLSHVTAHKMLQQVRRGLEHNTFDAP